MEKVFGLAQNGHLDYTSEETVRLVIQEEYFHNFRIFSNTAICRIIMSKSRKLNNNELPLAA